MHDSTAARLRHARTLAGDLQPGELSRLAGLAASHVAAIESGARAQPQARTLVQIADVLGVDLAWLLQGAGRPPSRSGVRQSVAAARAAMAARA